MRVRRDPGTVIAGPRGVVYTPPVGEGRIRQLLANWERFLHDPTDLDPLVRMAIAHYQFEAIHPFTDGNGRTGRVLNTLFLVEQGLLSRPILYLSRYINIHRAEYYLLLLDVTRADAWEPWILYVLEGVEETAAWTTAKIEAIRRLQEETLQFVRARAPRTWQRRLIDLVFEHPYCRIADVVEAGIAERPDRLPLPARPRRARRPPHPAPRARDALHPPQAPRFAHRGAERVRTVPVGQAIWRVADGHDLPSRLRRRLDRRVEALCRVREPTPPGRCSRDDVRDTDCAMDLRTGSC